MNKILLSMLGIFTVIGSASALPAPEDRRALCEQNPDQFVWVKKNKTCIPIHPCKSANDDIVKFYCLNLDDKTWLPFDNNDNMQKILDRFAKEVFDTTVSSFKIHSPESDDSEGSVAVNFNDGMYYEIPGFKKWSPSVEDVVKTVALAYGYDKNSFKVMPYGDGLDIINVDNFTKCENLADFASLIYGDVLQKYYSENTKFCQIFLHQPKTHTLLPVYVTASKNEPEEQNK